MTPLTVEVYQHKNMMSLGLQVSLDKDVSRSINKRNTIDPLTWSVTVYVEIIIMGAVISLKKLV